MSLSWEWLWWTLGLLLVGGGIGEVCWKLATGRWSWTPPPEEPATPPDPYRARAVELFGGVQDEVSRPQYEAAKRDLFARGYGATEEQCARRLRETAWTCPQCADINHVSEARCRCGGEPEGWEYEVWLGDECLGMVEAYSFPQACRRLIAADPLGIVRDHFDPKRLTVNGIKLTNKGPDNDGPKDLEA
ncbi:hypothetical protein Bhz59_00089 [Stenotrophomonas phage vB_SmaS_Bhz59]